MSNIEKTIADVERRDIIGTLKDDIEKVVLLGGDITSDYLPMCGDPRDLPDDEKTKFMRDLLWQYHRYSITMELLMEQIIKIRDNVNQL